MELKGSKTEQNLLSAFAGDFRFPRGYHGGILSEHRPFD